MGRTNPTYRDALDAIETRWEDYRRGLRRRDQPHYDRLWTYARDHADASGYLNHQNPIVPALVSIILEQERQLQDHTSQLEAIETALSADTELTTITDADSPTSPSDASE